MSRQPIVLDCNCICSQPLQSRLYLLILSKVNQIENYLVFLYWRRLNQIKLSLSARHRINLNKNPLVRTKKVRDIVGQWQQATARTVMIFCALPDSSILWFSAECIISQASGLSRPLAVPPAWANTNCINHTSSYCWWHWHLTAPHLHPSWCSLVDSITVHDGGPPARPCAVIGDICPHFFSLLFFLFIFCLSAFSTFSTTIHPSL